MNGEVFCFDAVAPVRERGLKLSAFLRQLLIKRRSRKGAWIEIKFNRSHGLKTTVAPVRERGLKYAYNGRPIDVSVSLP